MITQTHPSSSLLAIHDTPVTYADILAARDRIADLAIRTPLIRSEALSVRYGCQVYLKLEMQQKTAAFKVRGASNAILSLPSEVRAHGLITASSGNHAQGVAYAAVYCGVDDCTTIVVPRTTPMTKIQNTRAHGRVNVELVGDNYDEASVYAHHLAEQHDTAYIEPYNAWPIIAGQGTVGLEIVEDLPNVDAVIVPVGGGGLIAGIALAVKSQKPNTRVYGVRAPNSRLADGIRVKALGSRPQLIIDRYVDDLTLIDDQRIAQAVGELASQAKVIAEGAGAVGLGALMMHTWSFQPTDKVVLMLSGGNIDPDRLAEMLKA